MNSSGTQYRQFLEETKGLKGALDTLGTQVRGRERIGRAHGLYDASSDELRHNFFQAVGDYEKTLKDCEKFLADKSAVVTNGDGVVQRVRWGLGTEAQVEGLTQRLRAHSAKIQILLEPLKAEQLAGMEDMLYENYQSLHPPPRLDLTRIPSAVLAGFERCHEEALIQRGTVFHLLARKVKFEALDSIVAGPVNQGLGNINQATKSHLKTFKLAFLLDRSTNEPAFSESRSGSIYRRRIFELWRRTASELNPLDLTPAIVESLSSLENHAFCILQPLELSLPSFASDERAGEEKLLEIDLSDAHHTNSKLMVYRRGPQFLRIAKVQMATTGSTSLRDTDSEKINIMSDLLLPMYAVTAARGTPVHHPAYNLVIRDRDGSRQVSYTFQGSRDAYAMQRAITGYEILSDIDGGSWAWHRSGAHRSSNEANGRGKVQMWRWNPPKPIDQQKTTMNAANSSDSGFVSDEAASTAATPITKANQSRLTDGLRQSAKGNATISVVGTTDGRNAIVVADTLLPPKLIVFTKFGQAFGFLAIDSKYLFLVDSIINKLKHFITVDYKLYVKPKSQMIKGKVYHRTTIESHTHKFMIHKVTDQSRLDGEHLETWNLSVFCHPCSDPSANHPDYSTAAFKAIELNWLTLDFPTALEMEKFCREFRGTAKIRRREEAERESIFGAGRHLEANPSKAAGERAFDTFHSSDRGSSQTTIKPTSPNTSILMQAPRLATTTPLSPTLGIDFQTWPARPD